jgi:nucleotide-binding universal stress UspA family protein
VGVIEMKRVLCPTDLSDVSVRAFDYAAAVAGWYGARLTVLHVVAPLPAMVGVSGAMLPPPPPEPEDYRSALERFVADRAPTGIRPVETVIATGNPAARVVECAEETGADLVVVGTHGRHGLPRWLLGSVAEQLLRASPCPVLAVPPHAEDAASLPLLLERLLCAVDFSESSLRAVELAFSLAQETDAVLALLHVVEALPPSTPFAPMDISLARHLRFLTTEAEARLRQVVPQGARDWCSPEVCVVSGKPWREIVREASARRSSMVVMGVHGHGSFERFFFGSTATAVLRHSECPVLVVRPTRPPVEGASA